MAGGAVRTAPSSMRAVVEEYLAYRRRLGFALEIEGQQLHRFARFADQQGHPGFITTDLAVAWATLPTGADRRYHARRLDMVRRLARHRAMSDPETEIPLTGLLGPTYSRHEPHIYSDAEIAALLHAAAQLGPRGGLRPHTYSTLFGLLACTGLRISEALRLSRTEVDLAAGVLVVAAGKFRRSRLVPLDPTVVQHLLAYDGHRDAYRRSPSATTFFVSEHGTSLKYLKVLMTFAQLQRTLGWVPGRRGRRPRLHDLRHTFAVSRLLRWYEQGAELNRKLLALSTYLGHVRIRDTYWYLTAVPALLAMAGARFAPAAACIDREIEP